MSLQHRWDAFASRLFRQNQFAIKLGLDNIRRALEREGHPERHAPAIIVGGTNGKGSTAAFLSGILQAHGLRVGLYTSPHLIDVSERFRVDGQPLPPGDVLPVGELVLREYGDASSEPCLTFFELTTLMAALLFRDADVDVTVWEVGLGGRLDAVNAVEPALTVVTNIGFDHQQWLGESIAEIAREKAGLRRPGVPLVLGPQDWPEAERELTFPETRRVVAPLARSPDVEVRGDVVVDESRRQNIATAREAASLFLAHDHSEALADEAVERVRWPGRLELCEARGRRFLLDAAHNVAGTRRLAKVLDGLAPDVAVVGAMADKDLATMFEPLTERALPTRLAAIDNARAASIEDLRATVDPVIGAGRASDMFDAVEPGELCVVFGSIYLLGEWFRWAGVEAHALRTWR